MGLESRPGGEGNQNGQMGEDGEAGDQGAVTIRGDEERVVMSPSKLRDENMMNDGEADEPGGQMSVDARVAAAVRPISRGGAQQVFSVSNTHQRQKIRGYYGSQYGGGQRSASATARRQNFFSGSLDQDEFMYDYDYAYARNPTGLIFNITFATLRPEQIIRNTVTHAFYKTDMDEPLFIQAYRPQEIFKVSFRQSTDCRVHTEYIKFLQRKEQERQETQQKRK